MDEEIFYFYKSSMYKKVRKFFTIIDDCNVSVITQSDVKKCKSNNDVVTFSREQTRRNYRNTNSKQSAHCLVLIVYLSRPGGSYPRV